MLTTTLTKIESHSSHAEHATIFADGFTKLLTYLGKSGPDYDALSLETILKSSGAEYAIWCLRAVDGYDKQKRLLACQCAISALAFDKQICLRERAKSVYAPNCRINGGSLYARIKALKEPNEGYDALANEAALSAVKTYHKMRDAYLRASCSTVDDTINRYAAECRAQVAYSVAASASLAFCPADAAMAAYASLATFTGYYSYLYKCRLDENYLDYEKDARRVAHCHNDEINKQFFSLINLEGEYRDL